MTLDLFQPRNLEEAYTLLTEKEGALVLAGGTDIIASRERGDSLPPVLVGRDRLGLDCV